MFFLKKFSEFLYKHAIFILVMMIMISGTILFRLRSEEIKFPSSKPLYHFYFIGQNSVDPFWNQVMQGVEKSAKDHNVVVEFCMPRFSNPQEELKYINIATISKVDGIITHVPNMAGFTGAIDRAYENGIPVITIENDDTDSKRYAFVGTNSFVIGREGARLLIEATGGRANIAVISSSDIDQGSIDHNLKMNGFISALRDYPDMRIVKSYTSKMGILSAEEITQAIIDSEDDINAIFTVSTVDTLGTAQFIVDRNRVGDIMLVGYGRTEEILRYIDKQVIFGTAASDPFRMGYESVKALVDIKSGNSVPTFIDTGVSVITKRNLENFKK